MATKRSYVMLSLLQCGETSWQSEGRLHGWTDLPLTAAGRAAITDDIAHHSGPRIATIYHPTDEAATETARLWAQATDAKMRGVAELANPNFGLFEGLRAQELADRHPKRHKQWQDDPLSLMPPEGEPIGQARTRILQAVSRLVKKTRANEIAFVLHPIALGLLRCRFADRPGEDLWKVLKTGTRVERFALSLAWADRLLEPVGAAASETLPASAPI